MSYVPRLKKHYKEEVVPQMMEQFQYSSLMEVPKIGEDIPEPGIG
jgi:large subunit ribosomal protein L5